MFFLLIIVKETDNNNKVTVTTLVKWLFLLKMFDRHVCIKMLHFIAHLNKQVFKFSAIFLRSTIVEFGKI